MRTQYNFTEVTQPQFNTKRSIAPLKSRSIRLRPSGISLSKDVVQRFTEWYRDGSYANRLFVKIEIDTKKKAIRLTNSSQAAGGHSFQLWPSGAATISTLPRDIKVSDLPLGDYQTCNQNNVFKLVK